MDIVDFILFGTIACILIMLAHVLIGMCIKRHARKTDDFIFWYRWIPRRIARPDPKISKYYDRFPRKDGFQWSYSTAIDDPWLIALAENVMAKVGNRSDKYRAGYICALTQGAYTYRRDVETYGDNEKWAFPVCTGLLHIGDCEDGALLGAGLSTLCGLDAVMVSVTGHALYGVNVKGFGRRVEHKGKRYLLCETTSVTPMGIVFSMKELLGCFAVMDPPKNYTEVHTYVDPFDKYVQKNR